jgi:hypothetical protein
LRTGKEYSVCSLYELPVDVNIFYIMDYGPVKFMFPILTQVKILTSIYKMSFLTQNLTLFRMVSSFHHFKQKFMLVFTFFMGNLHFFTIKLKKAPFPVNI